MSDTCLRDIVSQDTVHKINTRAHPKVQALLALEVRHLPNLTQGEIFEAIEHIDDESLDYLEIALDENSVERAFSRTDNELSLFNGETVDLFMRVTPLSTVLPNAIPIHMLAKRLEQDSYRWTVSPKLINLAFCRLDTTDASLMGITDAIDVVLQARKHLNASDAGLIVDLSANRLDDSHIACKFVADLAKRDDIAYITILGQNLAKSVNLHSMLLKNGHLHKIISLLHNVLVGGRFPGSDELHVFMNDDMTVDMRETYMNIRECYETLYESIETPKKMATTALYNVNKRHR